MISDYITDKEYRCRCCNKLPVDFYVRGSLGEIAPLYLMLFKYFKDIREAWGRAIAISSGYRCPKRNISEGGAPYSIHLFGLALDLDCKDPDETKKMSNLIKGMSPNLRIGTYTKPKTHTTKSGAKIEIIQSFLHVDVGYFIFPRIDERWRKGARWNG